MVAAGLERGDSAEPSTLAAFLVDASSAAACPSFAIPRRRVGGAASRSQQSWARTTHDVAFRGTRLALHNGLELICNAECLSVHYCDRAQ